MTDTLEKRCERPGCPNKFIVKLPERKPQLYCSVRCRVIVSRERQEKARKEVFESEIANLRKTWNQFSPEVQAGLESIFAISNLETAKKATETLMLLDQECKALARVRYREGYEAGKAQI
jgi:hypothetical protein